jgi:hypothetical protein
MQLKMTRPSKPAGRIHGGGEMSHLKNEGVLPRSFVEGGVQLRGRYLTDTERETLSRTALGARVEVFS